MANSAVYYAQLGDRQFELSYPDSDGMRDVLHSIVSGREYPLVFPQRFQPTTILDVGANVGAAAIWFRTAYPQAQVICYEPSPSLFPYLESNVSTLPHIHACNVGLSDRNAEEFLHLSDKNVAQHSVHDSLETSGRTEPIVLRDAGNEIDSLGLDHISLLKLDTEGCELPILTSMRHWLDRTAAIYVEYHSESDRRKIDALMADDFYLIHANVHHPNLGTLVYFSKAVTEMTSKYVSPPLGAA